MSAKSVMREELREAIKKYDVAEVERILDVPWDRVKRRRIEAAGDDPLRDDCLGGLVFDCWRDAKKDSDATKACTIMKLLMQNGAKHYLQEADGTKFSWFVKLVCPMYDCPSDKRIEMARALIEGGVDMNLGNDIYLAILFFRNNISKRFVEFLIDHGLPRLTARHLALVITKNPSFRKFHLALKHLQPDAWSKLHEYGVDDIYAWLASHGAKEYYINYIKELPIKKIESFTTSTPDDLVGQDCSICYEEYSQSGDDNKIAKLPCRHVFHASCMMTVAESGDPRCPYCRQPYV